MMTFIFIIMAITIVVMVVANMQAQNELKSRKDEKKDRYKALKTDTSGKYPLHVRNAFLNYNEMPLYEAMQEYLPGGFMICPKICLQNVLLITAGGGWNESDVEKMADKKLDFLICETSSMKPLIGIEMGLSAVNEDEKFVEKACRDAGLKFVRFASKDRYFGEEIAQVLDAHLPKKERFTEAGVDL